MIHDIKLELWRSGGKKPERKYFMLSSSRKDGTLSWQLSRQIRSNLDQGYEVRLSVPPDLFTQRRIK